jgi:hypothetical protein
MARSARSRGLRPRTILHGDVLAPYRRALASVDYWATLSTQDCTGLASAA